MSLNSGLFVASSILWLIRTNNIIVRHFNKKTLKIKPNEIDRSNDDLLSVLEWFNSNPDGVDLSEEEWSIILKLFKK